MIIVLVNFELQIEAISLSPFSCYYLSSAQLNMRITCAETSVIFCEIKCHWSFYWMLGTLCNVIKKIKEN